VLDSTPLKTWVLQPLVVGMSTWAARWKAGDRLDMNAVVRCCEAAQTFPAARGEMEYSTGVRTEEMEIARERDNQKEGTGTIVDGGPSSAGTLAPRAEKDAGSAAAEERMACLVRMTAVDQVVLCSPLELHASDPL